jgi:hypothetical protein
MRFAINSLVLLSGNIIWKFVFGLTTMLILVSTAEADALPCELNDEDYSALALSPSKLTVGSVDQLEPSDGQKLCKTRAFAKAVITAKKSGSAAASAAKTPDDPSSPLTPEFMIKMVQLIALKGDDRVIPAAFANALGLTATGQPWPTHQIGALRGSTDLHSFAYNNGNDQDLLLTRKHQESVFAYRAHRDGKVVTALLWNKQTKQITMRDRVEAQAELDSEITFWAETIRPGVAGQ